MVWLLFEMIIDIGPKIYSRPSPNNNDDNFYQQIDKFSNFLLHKIAYRNLPTAQQCQFLGLVFFCQRI